MNPNIHTAISEFGIPSEQPCVIKTLLATRLMRWDAYASITGFEEAHILKKQKSSMQLYTIQSYVVLWQTKKDSQGSLKVLINGKHEECTFRKTAKHSMVITVYTDIPAEIRSESQTQKTETNLYQISSVPNQ